MHRFNPPPSWPTPSSASWRPPVGWRPDPAWPAAPAGWEFWVDRFGRPASGPIGAFGAVESGRLELAVADRSLLLMHG